MYPFLDPGSGVESFGNATMVVEGLHGKDRQCAPYTNEGNDSVQLKGFVIDDNRNDER